MARLFVVNTTGQDRIINYRTEFTVDDEGRRTTERLRPYKSVTLRARTQMPLGGDMSLDAARKVIETLEKTCGAVPVTDISRAKARGPVKMIWNLDTPVPVAVLKDVVHHNIRALTDLGEERRRRLAIGANFTMGSLSDPTKDTIRSTEVEFESVGGTEDSDLISPSLTEGFKVAKTTAPRGSRRKAV